MGNCEPCTRVNAIQNQPVLSKQDLIDKFESVLPFKSLFIDEYENIVLAAACIQKINKQYEPPLLARRCKLRRLVKYFKNIEEWSTL